MEDISEKSRCEKLYLEIDLNTNRKKQNKKLESGQQS